MLDPIPLAFPDLPDPLAGLTIMHLTDLHIDQPRRRHRRIIQLLQENPVDLIALTGDYMSYPGDEDASEAAMRLIAPHFGARLGTFGVYGNHDTFDLRHRLRDLPVKWMDNQTQMIDGLPLRITGMHTIKYVDPDSVAMLHQSQRVDGDDVAAEHRSADVFELMLCHHPTYLPVAADLGMDLVLSGHTHGGQCRLPGGQALINSTDLPLRLTSGVLRHRETLCVVSRGLGEVLLPLRVFCPPQLPVYRLMKGPLVGEACGLGHVYNTQPW